VGIMGSSLGDGPRLHPFRNLIGDFSIDLTAGKHSSLYFFQGILGQVLEHFFLIEYVGAKHFGASSRFVYLDPGSSMAFFNGFKSNFGHFYIFLVAAKLAIYKKYSLKIFIQQNTPKKTGVNKKII